MCVDGACDRVCVKWWCALSVTNVRTQCGEEHELWTEGYAKGS